MNPGNVQSEFDPVRCYEELRVNILEDPFYSSWGKGVLQNRGMRCWLDGVTMINAKITVNDIPEIESIPSRRGLDTDKGFRNELKTLLADITANLYREALHV